MATNSAVSVLKNRGFLNLWVNQILVQLSYNCLNFGLLVWVYHLTQSSAAVSLLIISMYLPSVIFGLFAGVLVDITDRKKIIMIINILLVICFLSLMVLKGSLLAILVVVFVINSLVQFYVPAESSAIPLICHKNQLLAANSLFSITLFGSFLGGFGIAGPLINLFEVDFVFGFGAVLLSIAFILSFLFPPIRSTLDPLGKKLTNAFKDINIPEIKEVGVKEIANTFSLIRGRVAVMASLFILASIQVGIAILGALIPSFFEGFLNMSATNASLILILPLGIGMVIGGVFLSRFGYLIPKRTIVSGGIITAGLLFLIVGVSPNLLSLKTLVTGLNLELSLITGAFLLGLAMVSIVVPSQTALQEYSPEKDRGKVYSVLSVLMSAMSIGPVIVTGFLADKIGILPVFTAVGTIILLLGILAFRPNYYFSENQLPYRVRQFLGLGHWKD